MKTRRIFASVVILMVFVLLLLSCANQKQADQNPDSVTFVATTESGDSAEVPQAKPETEATATTVQINIDNTTRATPAQDATELNTSDVKQVDGTHDAIEPTEVTVPVQIERSSYNPMWEYLEYGFTKEYYQKQQVMVSFKFNFDGLEHVIKFYPGIPEFRSFVKAFPNTIAYINEGYVLTAIRKGMDFSEVVSIADKNGNVVWERGSEEGPRELNALESWLLHNLVEHGHTGQVSYYFDRIPDCVNSNTCDLAWSLPEIRARSDAFHKYVTNPESNVFVQIWGAVDANYRYIDNETGEVLELVDPRADLWKLPDSGWLGLQIDYSFDDKDWETTYVIKVSPGFVVGIDQIGQVFSTGPADWVLRENGMALRTAKWEMEEILNILQTPETAASEN